MTTAVGDSETYKCRWLDAVRYAVAAAVTVLIMAVVVNAIKVVLRPEPLQLSVDRGCVVATTTPPPLGDAPPTQMKPVLDLTVTARNPSGRVRMYYSNISAYLFDNKTSASASTDPSFDSMFYTRQMKDMAVAQLGEVRNIIRAAVSNITMPDYFDFFLYKGGRMSDVTLRLDGSLTTELTSELNKTSPRTYYCEQLVVGRDSDCDIAKEVTCTDDSKGGS